MASSDEADEALARAVVLDANALLMPFQFKLNLDLELRRLFGDVPVYVPSSVLGELSNARDTHARGALALARKYQVVDTRSQGDDAIVELAVEKAAAVVTNDKELIGRLREAGIQVVRLRSMRHLETTA